MRVVWLCEEVGLDYTLSSFAMFTAEMKTKDYLRIHPLGKVPAIEDDGFILWETGAIFEYLVDKYSDGELIPPRGTESGALAAQWIGYGENPLTNTAEACEDSRGSQQWGRRFNRSLYLG